MKKVIKLVIVLVIISVSADMANAQKRVKSLKEYSDSISYAIGVEMAKDLKDRIKIEEDVFNMNVYLKGFTDYYQGEDLFLQEDTTSAILKVYFAEKIERDKIKAKEEGINFLSENKDREGVFETESGLQYEILQTGEGRKPLATDRVKVHYAGSLIDGTEFDSSYKRGEPIVFGLSQVIEGWTEALQLMSVGSKWKIFIPSELAYGENGKSPVIPPNSVLIFEVELLGIE